MRGLRYLALGLACALSAAQPVHATDQAAARKADAARTQARLAFQRDLVSVLAPRADAMPLLAAALLARPLPDPPRLSDFHALIGRAAAASDHGPAVDWVRLADCDERADACPNAAALAALVQEAPDNAAVWLLKLGLDLRDMKKDEARADLARAAAAKLYDDYTGASLQALASNVTLLPPPPAALGPQGGPAGTQAVLVFGLAGTQPQPGLQAAAKLCEEGAGDAGVKADCLKLGKLLEWGSSPLARSLGLHLRETLDDDPARQEDAKRARRDLVWQVQNFAGLSARAPAEPALAQHLLALARSGGTEMSLVLAALRDRGIPTEPPADWEPQAAAQDK
ncbi:hypothetical protein [Fulvimonas soli]|uniref:Uncharacterized protein n=1 Tax=Fulvimonas soli TaxID=155197 RepID=A0A316IQ02_9GAMM|nr:hypothetical protein [Fulvimonas soli]PWK92608.1 hypothetical protein C7456_102343 [Fulvimonas soli]TNY27812.1 hypothetical protein BV497_02000 [Fulvimonas soli]